MAVDARQELEELRRLEQLERKAMAFEAPATPEEKVATKQATLEQKDSFLNNLARGAKKRALGISQVGDALQEYSPATLLFEAAVPEAKAKRREIRKTKSDLAEQYQDESRAAGFNFGEILGDPLTWVPVGPISGVTKGKRALEAALQGLKFGAVSGATDPLAEGDSRTKNALLQGGLGFGFGAVTQPVMDLASQGIKGLGQQLFKVDPEKIAQMEAAGMKPTVQATTERPWVAQAANVLENIPGVGKRFRETAKGYEEAAAGKLTKAGMEGITQPEPAGEAILKAIAREETIPEQRAFELAKEVEGFRREGIRQKLADVIPNPKISDEQAGKSLVEGINRYVNKELASGAKLKGEVTKALKGQRIPAPNLVEIERGLPFASLDKGILDDTRAFINQNTIEDLGTGQKYIDIDALNTLKSRLGKATNKKEAATANAIYSQIKDIERNAAQSADTYNSGVVEELINKYSSSNTPEEIAAFEQQLYGRNRTAAGMPVSEATELYNRQYREGLAAKKGLADRITKEPILQDGREVYAKMPLEKSYQKFFSDVKASPSLVDEYSKMLTAPRQKALFSASMKNLAKGNLSDVDTWAKNYAALSPESKSRLVFGNNALAKRLDDLAQEALVRVDVNEPMARLAKKFGAEAPEDALNNIVSGLKKGGTELAELRGVLSPEENQVLTDGLFRQFAADDAKVSKIKWADNWLKMSDKARDAFANEAANPGVRQGLDALATAIQNIKGVQGFDTARNVNRLVSTGVMAGPSGILALMFGVHVGGAALGGSTAIGYALSRLMNDPNATRALANWTRLAPTDFGTGRRAALSALYDAISNSEFLNDSEKEALIKANESPVIRDPKAPGGYKLDMEKGGLNAAPVNDTDGSLPPVNEPVPDQGAQAEPTYLQRLAQVENAGRETPDKNPVSSATGKFQITDGTWRGLQRKYPELQGADKNDPRVQEQATLLLQQESDDAITDAGLPVNDDTRSFVHFMGEPDARVLLKNLDNRVPAATLTPAAARSNPGYFYERLPNGKRRARTPREVFEYRARKMSRAASEIQLARR